MRRDSVIKAFSEALHAITEPRLFETERGFQGALITQLAQRIKLQPPAIIEQEYQKNVRRHGLQIRPDIVLHEPFESSRHNSPREGNLAVAELKLRAREKQAQQALDNLALVMTRLDYPVGFFINIACAKTFAELVPISVRGRVVCFAVRLAHGPLVIQQPA